MADLARLGIVIDSSDLRDGEQNMDRFVRKAVSTEQRVKAMGNISSASFRKIGASSGQIQGTTMAVTNFNRVVQDAPFGIMGVANNLEPMIQSFNSLKAQTGSTTKALKTLLTSAFTGPGALITAVSVASSILIAFGDDLFGMGKKADEVSEDIKSLREEVDGYLESIGNLQGEIALDDLGTQALERQIENTRTLRDELGQLYDLQEKRAELERFLFTRVSAAATATEISDAQAELRAVNTELERQSDIFGPLTDLSEEFLNNKLATLEADLAYQKALRRLNPALARQSEITEKLTPALRDMRLGLAGAASTLEGLVAGYDEEIKRLRDSNELTEDQKQILLTLIQAREQATKALEAQTKAQEEQNLAQLEEIYTIRERARAERELSNTTGVNGVGLVDRELIRDIERQFAQFERLGQLFDDYDVGAAKAKLLRSEIERLIKSGEGHSATINELHMMYQLWTGEGLQSVRDLNNEVDSAKSKTDTLRDVTRELGLTFTSAFEDALIAIGETENAVESLRGILQGLLQDIARLFIRQKVTEPLFGAIMNSVGGSSGNSTGSSTGGEMFGWGTGVPTTSQMKASGGMSQSKVNVNVINQNGSKVDVQTRETPAGVDVQMIVRNEVKNMVNNGGLDREMSSNYGVRRGGVNRG